VPTAAREEIEADVMREYDDGIRLYTPLVKRAIVLGAVMVAVPVVLWTITTFVRAYIGPPQIPTFRPIAAATAPSASQDIASEQNVQVAAQTANSAIATDARTPLLEIKKPADPAPASPSAASAATPAAPPAPVRLSSVPPPPFAAANPNTGASTSAMPATVAAPPGIAPVSAAAADAAQPAAQPPASAAVTTPAATPSTLAWPSPTAFAPSSPSSAVASAEPATADHADTLPLGTPLTGRIPLPPHRPKIAAQIATMTNLALAANAAPVSPALPSRVPLPRARPAAAPEPTPVAPSYQVYDPGALH
jgi:hypothetical protein